MHFLLFRGDNLKKIGAIILIFCILFAPMIQQRTAFIPLIPIVLGASELEALACLVASGVAIYSVPAAVDLAEICCC